MPKIEQQRSGGYDANTSIPKITHEGIDQSKKRLMESGPTAFTKLKEKIGRENPLLAMFIATHANKSKDPASVEFAMLDLYLLLESQYEIENEGFPEELDL